MNSLHFTQRKAFEKIGKYRFYSNKIIYVKVFVIQCRHNVSNQYEFLTDVFLECIEEFVLPFVMEQ